MQYRIHHLMNYKKFRCVLRLSDKDWRIWRLWLTISCLHSSTCESWSPPIYCWRSSSKHCQSSKHSGRVCHGRHFECAIIFKYLYKCEDTYFILQNKYGCVVLPWHFEFYILKCKNLKCKKFFDWFSRWIRQF